MKLSIAICTHNEGMYIVELLNRLAEHIQLDRSGVQYEIVIVDDFSTDVVTKTILDAASSTFKNLPNLSNLLIESHALQRDYASHKNFMNGLCTGDWILNLDADEWVSADFLDYVPMVIDMNPEIEAYWIPRINTVDGLTRSHISKWNWVITKMDDMRKIKQLSNTSDEYKLLKDFNFIINEENGIVTYYEPIIMWPDLQMRLYRNISRIKWINKVHEQLIGFEKFGILPQESALAIRHFKDITRQEQQNAFYSTIER